MSGRGCCCGSWGRRCRPGRATRRLVVAAAEGWQLDTAWKNNSRREHSFGPTMFEWSLRYIWMYLKCLFASKQSKGPTLTELIFKPGTLAWQAQVLPSSYAKAASWHRNIRHVNVFSLKHIKSLTNSHQRAAKHSGSTRAAHPEALGLYPCSDKIFSTA